MPEPKELKEPKTAAAGLKAIVFDVDGTLYRQGPLRRAMAMRLLRAHAVRPLAGLRTFRVLSAYRRAQEKLRDGAASIASTTTAMAATTAATMSPAKNGDLDLAEAQIRLACERANADRAFVTTCVSRWMEQEPLPLLARFAWPGLLAFLEACKARGLRLGVLSDYPAEAKLEALGLRGLFEAVLCAQAPEIGVFKPHPRGLQVALERLGARADESLYVGDRVEVDAVTAAAAGVPCAIVGQTTPRPSDANGNRTWLAVARYEQLKQLLFPS